MDHTRTVFQHLDEAMASTTRSLSARGRAENRLKYPFSYYGHIEPIDIEVEIRALGGRLFLTTKVHDYSGTGCLYIRLAQRLSVVQSRLRIYWKEQLFPGNDPSLL